VTTIHTEDLTPESLRAMSERDAHQVYCGLDCAITFEVHEALAALLGGSERDAPAYPLLYSFERALQAPALDMMLRGFRIDAFERARAIALLEAQVSVLQAQLDILAAAVWSRPLNPGSSKQLREFFYERMRLPEVTISQKGVKRVSANREALEKLEVYLHARPIVALVTEIRDRLGVLRQLKSELDPDGRFRFSINIAGTETGRFSTSKSVTGTGSNSQNLKRDDDLEEGEVSVRRCFIADEEMKLCNVDLEQTESFDVGLLQGSLLDDWTYLNACEAGDLHTTVARMVWPELAWTGDKRRDREVANRPFYRHFSYRDMAKRGGHLSNYMGTAWTASRSLKVPLPVMENFRRTYTEVAFPAFPRWWGTVARTLQSERVLVTAYGRSRQFFGRPDDDATLREAIAFVPQSMTADRMNLGLWRVWRHMRSEVELLAQVHDSICFQFPESADADAIIARVLRMIESPLTVRGRVVRVRGEAKIGWNWGSFGPGNPDGLKKWEPLARDARTRGPSGRERTLA
jgi:DNA polymerase I-like protein with 3'-5' exonuclease and polymerase domains